MMAESPGALSVSPVGPLTDAGSRKTLIYLILTLNHMYPDYDFSALRGHHFTKENAVPASALGSGAPPHVMRVKNDVDGLLLETAKAYEATVGAGAEPLSSELWRAIDAAIRLVDCDVYTYKAVAEGDPFCDDGNLWSFNYFFYNRKLKRILYFSCRAVSKTADEESDFEDGEDALGPMDDSNATCLEGAPSAELQLNLSTAYPRKGGGVITWERHRLTGPLANLDFGAVGVRDKDGLGALALALTHVWVPGSTPQRLVLHASTSGVGVGSLVSSAVGGRGARAPRPPTAEETSEPTPTPLVEAWSTRRWGVLPGTHTCVRARARAPRPSLSRTPTAPKSRLASGPVSRCRSQVITPPPLRG